MAERLPVTTEVRRTFRRAAALVGRVPQRRFPRPGRAGARVVAAGVLLLLLAGTGAIAAPGLLGQYGGARAHVNALAWAARSATYSRSACAGCHGEQLRAQSGGGHAAVTCEVCHAPVADHPGTGQGVVALPVPDSGICVTCHARTAGRPASFPQVDLGAHYRGAACLRCHDPHGTVATAPPQVTHPLADLPACTTCHAPDGLKKFPANHELVADDICLSCHGPSARKP